MDIRNLYLFPVFQTREDYRNQTGQDAPLYDENRDIKSWYDPTAAAHPRPKITYDRVIALGDDGRSPAVDDQGQPFFEPLVIERDWAARVNIPPKAIGQVPDRPTTGKEVPVPCRALRPTEFLKLQFGGTLALVDTASEEFQQQPDQVMARVLARLDEMNTKLDQVLAKG